MPTTVDEYDEGSVTEIPDIAVTTKIYANTGQRCLPIACHIYVANNAFYTRFPVTATMAPAKYGAFPSVDIDQAVIDLAIYNAVNDLVFQNRTRAF